MAPQNGPARRCQRWCLDYGWHSKTCPETGSQNRAEHPVFACEWVMMPVPKRWLRKPARAFLAVMRPDVVKFPSPCLHRAHVLLVDGILTILCGHAMLKPERLAISRLENRPSNFLPACLTKCTVTLKHPHPLLSMLATMTLHERKNLQKNLQQILRNFWKPPKSLRKPTGNPQETQGNPKSRLGHPSETPFRTEGIHHLRNYKGLMQGNHHIPLYRGWDPLGPGVVLIKPSEVLAHASGIQSRVVRDVFKLGFRTQSQLHDIVS